MDKYIKGEVLGEGTFGVVFKATHKEVCREYPCLQMQPWPVLHQPSSSYDSQTGQVVAIKKIRLGKASEVSREDS